MDKSGVLTFPIIESILLERSNTVTFKPVTLVRGKGGVLGYYDGGSWVVPDKGTKALVEFGGGDSVCTIEGDSLRREGISLEIFSENPVMIITGV